MLILFKHVMAKVIAAAGEHCFLPGALFLAVDLPKKLRNI